MSRDEILAIGQKFSKSYYKWENKKQTEDLSDDSPWNPKNDPDLWMWKKTVLKQISKLIPKNSAIMTAIAEDHSDSVVQDKVNTEEVKSLTMGSVLTNDNYDKEKTGAEKVIDQYSGSESEGAN